MGPVGMGRFNGVVPSITVARNQSDARRVSIAVTAPITAAPPQI